MRFFYLFCLSLLFAIFYSACASRARPGGGPVDKTAPLILKTFPQSDSTNLRDLKEIQFQFSERMDESSVVQAVFISPPIRFESNWSGGDELTLNLEEELKPDQTYVVTIGSGAKDMRNNRMERSFQLAFSSGPVIDRGKINGRIFGVNPSAEYYIFAYRINDQQPPDPTRIQADYLTQPDNKDHSFSLAYLAWDKYRLFVVEDQNKNLLLDSDYEQIGLPFTDVMLDSLHQNFQPLNFMVSRVDTTAPFASGIRAQNRHTLFLRLSEAVVPVYSAQFSIIDTISGRELSIKAFSPSAESENQYIIYTADHDTSATYRFSTGAFTDTSGNTGPVTSLDYQPSAIQDTTGFRIESVLPADSAQNIGVDFTISLEFSKAVDTLSVISGFLCMNSNKDTVSMTWNWSELKTALVRPVDDMQRNSFYNFLVNTKNIRSLWNESLKDTVISRTFFLRPPDEYGYVSGNVVYPGERSAPAFIFINSLQKKRQIQLETDNDYSFRYDWMEEGPHQIGGFIDRDSNHKLSTGKLVPFNFAEPFNFNEDTVQIRKRWEISDVIVQIPEGAP